MKIYIGAKFKNAKLVTQLTETFMFEGIVNNYNWADGLKDEESEEDLLNSAKEEFKAIKDADAVIFLLPLGRGGYTELGMALMAGKPVILCAEEESEFTDDPINFYMLDGITKIASKYDRIDEVLLEELRKIKPKRKGKKALK